MPNGPDYDLTDVYTQARAFLNDQDVQVYADADLTQYADAAWEELQLELTVADVPVALGRAVIAVPANTTLVDYSTSPALPSNMWYPVYLEESQTGKNIWLPMKQVLYERTISAGDRPARLTVWAWREQKIYFEGCTEARDVSVHYLKALSDLSVVPTDLGRMIPFSRGFLSRKIAAFAFALQKKDFETAQIMQDEAVKFKDGIISIGVKQNQSMPVRRLGYRAGRRARVRPRIG